jgi:probable addiction module antidote protein
MPLKTLPWDAAEHLDSPEMIAAYLDAAQDEGDPKLVAAAIGDVARAHGMSQLARETGLSRESLYRSLSADGNPEFATILKVLHAFGLRLETRPLWPAEPETESAV